MTGATLCIPLLNTIVSCTTTMEYRGRMMGITSAAASWGRVAGPLSAGASLGLFGYQGAWLGSAAIVSVYLLWAFFESGRRGALADEVHSQV